MNRKTLKALKASIAKWEKNAAAVRVYDAKIQSISCPLCDLFYGVDCVGCPVAERALSDFCSCTPYVTASSRWNSWRKSPTSTDAAQGFRDAAKAEVDFLKSLLPTVAKAITAPTEEKAL